LSAETVVERVHRQIELALREAGLIDGKKLVVAVSGGPDSLAMLHALSQLAASLDVVLHGAHLDHGLRPGGSERDAAFVSETLSIMGLPGSIARRDVAAYRMERRLSPEQAAREVRYAFLGEVALAEAADAIVLAHTADDQAETVLMHVIRGSGTRGLQGMLPSTRRRIRDAEFLIVRPLLEVARSDTQAYCEAAGLSPVLDESNLSQTPTRNRVRLDLMPRLREYNPAVVEALGRLSRAASRDFAFVEEALDDVWRSAVPDLEGSVTIDRRVFSELASTLQGHLLMRAILTLRGSLDDVTEAHVDQALEMMGGPAGRSMDLPGGMRLSVSYETAAFSNVDAETFPLIDGGHCVEVPGESRVAGWHVVASEAGREQAPGPQLDARSTLGPDGDTAVFSADALGAQVTVRTRVPGDRFQPLGMTESKKLQDFMVDAKVPRHLRDRVPLVVTDRGIAWVAGWRIAEWAKVAGPTDRGVRLTFGLIGPEEAAAGR